MASDGKLCRTRCPPLRLLPNFRRSLKRKALKGRTIIAPDKRLWERRPGYRRFKLIDCLLVYLIQFSYPERCL